jgi:anti-sigma regulatory factor (Ser/Thr protein kinase)
MAEPALLVRSTSLDPVPASAGQARRLVRAALAEVGETAAVDSAEVAVSELVTNAILHAATTVELCIEVTERAVLISVADANPARPVQRTWSATATTGRGLTLVASLTDEHGVAPRRPTGKTVWFRLVRGT